MDSLGWFQLGLLAALIAGTSFWGAATNRKRAAAARVWAKSAGLTELPPGREGVRSDLAVRRARKLPSFVGALGGRQVSVIASSTRPRYGDLWVLCTHAKRPPVFLGNALDFGAVNVFGKGAPRGWVRVKAGGDIDQLFLVSVPAEAGAAPLLSDDARQALREASDHAWCFNVTPGGFTVLWFKQAYGQDTQEALTQAAQLLQRLLA